jgi:hypothetical protein
MLWLLAKGGIAMDNLVYPLGHSEFELERLKNTGSLRGAGHATVFL